MKHIVALVIMLLVGCGGNCYAQGRITRPGKQTTAPVKTSTSNQKSKPQTKPQSQAHNAVSRINVSSPDGYNNNHGFVDLGLPSGTKWATCNIGSSVPEKIGTYFAWGNTKPSTAYLPETTTCYDKNLAGLLQNNNLVPAYDAAHVNWGGPWRMPTRAELDELVKHCTCQWIDSPAGMKLTGPNGKTIFLPASGAKQAKLSAEGFGKQVNIWSATPLKDDTKNSIQLLLMPSRHDTVVTARDYGMNIRPVWR